MSCYFIPKLMFTHLDGQIVADAILASATRHRDWEFNLEYRPYISMIDLNVLVDINSSGY